MTRQTIALLICTGIFLAACTNSIRQVSTQPGASNSDNAETIGSDGQPTTAQQQMVQGYADIPISANDALIVSESLLFNSGEQWIGRAVLESQLSAPSAFDYYVTNMPSKGWIGITKVQSSVSVLAFEKGNRVATIQIEQRLGGKASIKVTVSPRESTVPATQ